MHRVVRQGNTFFSYQFDELEGEELLEILEFLESGYVVALGEDLEDIAKEFGISTKEIVAVK